MSNYKFLRIYKGVVWLVAFLFPFNKIVTFLAAALFAAAARLRMVTGKRVQFAHRSMKSVQSVIFHLFPRTTPELFGASIRHGVSSRTLFLPSLPSSKHLFVASTAARIGARLRSGDGF